MADDPQVTLPDVYVGAPPPAVPLSTGQAAPPTLSDNFNLALGGGVDLSAQSPEIAPLDAISSQRIAQHAGLPAPNTPLAALDGPMPETQDATDLHPDLRYHYAQALQGGDTSGPQDFAERAVGAAWQAASGGVADDDHDTNAAQVTNAAKSLASALPDPQDIDAHAATLLNQTFGVTAPGGDPDDVRNIAKVGIAKNLIDAWQDTGISPDKIMQKAAEDPDLANALSSPPPIPWQQSQHMPTLAELSVPGRDAISLFSPFGLLGGNMVTDPTGVGAMVSGLKGFPAAEAENEAKVQKIREAGGSMGDIFRQAMESPSIKMAASIALGGLAGKGAGEVAASIKDGSGLEFLKKLAADESGQLMPPNEMKRTVMRAGMDRWIGPTMLGKDAEIAGKTQSFLNQTAGKAENIIEQVGQMLDAERPKLNKYVPEDQKYARDISAHAEARTVAKENFVNAGGKEADFKFADPPPLSTLQAARDHMEQRPVSEGGGRIPPDHELYDVVHTMTGINVGMRDLIGKRWNVSDYIDHYYRGNYNDPAAVNRAFGGVGSAGSTASFRHKSIPYNFDAKVRGLTEKFPDPLDNMLHDVGEKAKYLAFEENLDHMVNTGFGKWSRTEPVPGWVKLRRDTSQDVGYVERVPEKTAGDEAAAGEEAQKQIRDTRYDAEMANKVGGPAAQGQLGVVGRDLVSGGEHSVMDPERLPGLARGAPGGQKLLEGPETPEDTRTRLQTPDKEYLWAHPSAAQTYNNGRGSAGLTGTVGNAARTMQVYGNFMTGLHLGMAGGHLMDMAWETAVSGLAHGIGEIASGAYRMDPARMGRALLDMGYSTAVVPRAWMNHGIAKEFRGTLLDDPKAPTTGLDPRIRQLYTDTNAQFNSRGSALEIGQSRNMVKAYRQGGLAIRAKALFGEPGATAGASPMASIKQVLKGEAQLAGDMVNTISSPTFDHIVPDAKMGTWLREVSAKLRNEPEIGYDQLLAWGNKLTSAIDNRFGEMNQDRLYFTKVIKQVLNSVMLSTGWKLGTWRAFKAGASDVARMRLNSPDARWLMAAPIGHAIFGQMYQYLATGTTVFNTGDWKDLILPRNGDTLQSGEPGRGMMLDPFKEFFDLYSAVFEASHSASKTQAFAHIIPNYIAQAVNPGLKPVFDIMAAPEGANWYKTVLGDLQPMGFSQRYGGKANTIGYLSTWLGNHPGPRSVTDPAALGDILNKHAAKVTYEQAYSEWQRDQQEANPMIDKPNRQEIYDSYDAAQSGLGFAPRRSRR